MRILLKTGESLTAVLSGAATTTNPTVLVDVLEGTQEETNSVSLSGATAVTLASAALTRKCVSGVSVCNVDTAAVTVTLARVNAAGTSYTLTSQTLQVGDTLLLNAAGLRVIDSSGQQKQSGVSTAVEPLAILPTDWRVHDAFASNLPATAASDDLGAVNGTDGTHFMSLRTIDFKAATTTAYARCFFVLPGNYVAGSAITIRVRAGMLTTVSDTSATVDLEVFSNDGDATGSADLCATSAQSINSLTFSNKDFTVTPTGLVAGQALNIRLVMTGTDGATGTAVIGAVAGVEVRTSVSR